MTTNAASPATQSIALTVGPRMHHWQVLAPGLRLPFLFGRHLRRPDPKGSISDAITHLLGQAPEGWLATPTPTPTRGSHANRSSRILNSLQTVMICPVPVITLAPPRDPSK
jgi:hypothetical protein